MYKYLIPSSSFQAIQRNDAASVAAFVAAYPLRATSAPLGEKIDLLKILRSSCGGDEAPAPRPPGAGCVVEYERAAATLLGTERNTKQLALVVQALGGQELLRQNFHRIQDVNLRAIATLALG
jgi:hypothetical protein